MSVRIEALAELKSIRFDKNETVFCVQNGREYYLELDGGSFTPDDIDFVQAIHGVNARYIAISGRGHSSTIASQTDAESGIENTKPMTSLRTKQAVTAYGELSANKGQANGYPSLDSSSRIPLAQLPTSVQTLKGSWNASTNTPTLADGTGTSGDTYRVSVAATRNLGSGNISFGVDDRVVYNGTTWEKWDTNDAVTSVHGRTGEVTAQAGDYAAFYDKWPVGSKLEHFGATAPTGFLACDGAAVSRSTYAALFAVISTTYGVGDGSTTFNLPDARGLVMVGAGAHGTLTRANGTAYNGGSVGASRNDQMQGHRHATLSPLTQIYGTGGTLNVSAPAVGSGFGTEVNSVGAPSSDSTNGTPRIGDETRPAEIAVLVCIKT